MIRKIYIIQKLITLSDYSTLVLGIIDNYQLVVEITAPILENIHGDTSYDINIWLGNLIKDLQYNKI